MRQPALVVIFLLVDAAWNVCPQSDDPVLCNVTCPLEESRRLLCVRSLDYLRSFVTLPAASKLSDAHRILSQSPQLLCASIPDSSSCLRDVVTQQTSLMSSLDSHGLCRVGQTPAAVAWARLASSESQHATDLKAPYNWPRVHAKMYQLNDLSFFEVRPSPIAGNGLFITRAVTSGAKLALAWWDVRPPRDASFKTFSRREIAFVPTECHFLPGEAPGAPTPISEGDIPERVACFPRFLNHACDANTALAFESGLPLCSEPDGAGRNCIPREIQALSKSGLTNITAVYIVATRNLTVGDEVTGDYHTFPPEYSMTRPVATWRDAVCQASTSVTSSGW
jgi:hypothetical protein